MPPTNSDLTTLLAAVEQAYDRWKAEGADGDWRVAEAAVNLITALRAARDSGYAVALVSREAVEALRLRLLPWGSHHPCCEKPEGQCTCGEEALARDLSALLKETP